MLFVGIFIEVTIKSDRNNMQTLQISIGNKNT